MKLDRKGIQFAILISFILISTAIVVTIGVLQVGLIRPYYRNNKINSTRAIAESIEDELLGADGGTEESVSQAFQEIVQNDVCVVIYNQSGTKVYESDLLGAGCIFHGDNSSDNPYQDSEYLMTLLSEDRTEYSVETVNEKTSQQMLIYGKKIYEDLSTYYLFMNTPLEPVDSIISFFSHQYVYYTAVVIVIVVLFSFWLSGKIANPLIRMKDEAVKLSNANYDVVFDGGSFTETQELASTLNKASEQLEKVDELRRDLMANVSHDIRTPLTNIRAYAEMVRDLSGDDPVKREKHLNVIIRETEYMTRLVNEMSELSKMQSGNYELHYENINLLEKVEEIIELDHPMIESSGVLVHVDIPSSIMIYADDLKIGEVIHNFLSNALKHTESGKNVTIRGMVLEDEETIRVEIIDEGEGIPEDEIEQIWNRYQKSSKSFSRTLTSTGLGLAIVKAILERHGANYGVTSHVGAGSTFWFELRGNYEG